MEIRQLRSFQTVANLLSFNKAADRLNYAQSSISAQIQALEEELGVQLFDRLGRKVQLTEAGGQLLEYANKILDLVAESHSEMAGEQQPKGSLTIRIPETFGSHRLPAVIKEFHTRFPKVRLNFITCAHEGLEKDLRKGLTDLAFLLTESFQASDLMAETLGFESVALVAGPRHRLAAQGTVLPEIAVAEEVAAKRLMILPWSEGQIEVALLMIWYRDRWLSPTLRAFMEVTKLVMPKNSAPSAPPGEMPPSSRESALEGC